MAIDHQSTLVGDGLLLALLPPFSLTSSYPTPDLIHNLLLSSSLRVTPNLPNVGAMALSSPFSPFPRLFPVALRFRRYTLSVFRTGSLPWCQRLRSSGPFESYPRRGGLERLDQKGMRIEKEGVQTRKGERGSADEEGRKRDSLLWT